ncbi:unnamed protein product [Heligmosomoides polygyrus]|uniref:Elongin-C n=1 Tax=Heligmosomoides polygyrus TaxID=6339 RepID=A0A183GPP0_HELPZ|nr:unnamed protein product [Heligmosomoides polygyrus]
MEQSLRRMQRFAQYVKLVSSGGLQFYVKKELAMTSGMIKTMLSGPGLFSENKCKEIPSYLLLKVCQYFVYKAHYTCSSTEVPEFVINPDMALDVLMVACFLDC